LLVSCLLSVKSRKETNRKEKESGMVVWCIRLRVGVATTDATWGARDTVGVEGDEVLRVGVATTDATWGARDAVGVEGNEVPERWVGKQSEVRSVKDPEAG